MPPQEWAEILPDAPRYMCIHVPARLHHTTCGLGAWGKQAGAERLRRIREAEGKQKFPEAKGKQKGSRLSPSPSQSQQSDSSQHRVLSRRFTVRDHHTNLQEIYIRSTDALGSFSSIMTCLALDERKTRNRRRRPRSDPWTNQHAAMRSTPGPTPLGITFNMMCPRSYTPRVADKFWSDV